MCWSSVTSALIPRKASGRARSHQLLPHAVVAPRFQAPPNACTAPQRVDGFAREFRSGLQRDASRSPFAKRNHGHAMPRRGASLRGALAAFFEKANARRGHCLFGGATHPRNNIAFQARIPGLLPRAREALCRRADIGGHVL